MIYVKSKLINSKRKLSSIRFIWSMLGNKLTNDKGHKPIKEYKPIKEHNPNKVCRISKSREVTVNPIIKDIRKEQEEVHDNVVQTEYNYYVIDGILDGLQNKAMIIGDQITDHNKKLDDISKKMDKSNRAISQVMAVCNSIVK